MKKSNSEGVEMVSISHELNNILLMVDDEHVKEKITDFFVKDVNSYSERLSKLDEDIESGDIPLDEACNMYSLATDEIIHRAEEIEDIVTGVPLREIKELFRRALSKSPAHKSVLAKRAYDKPRGYPGDYRIIEMFYDNTPVSEGIGYCIDKHYLNYYYTQAIRDRKNMMREILDAIMNNSDMTALNILNLGCGSCREIRELLQPGFKTGKKISFTLLDQDEEALDFSKKACSRLSEQISGEIQFRFVKESIFNLFNESNYSNILKGHDVIYSIGLADYLPDDFLGKVIRLCFDSLEPNGQLIIAHKDVKKYKASGPDWLSNWYFYPRDKEDLNNIINSYLSAHSFDLEFRKGESGPIFFIFLTKK